MSDKQKPNSGGVIQKPNNPDQTRGHNSSSSPAKPQTPPAPPPAKPKK